MDEGSKSHAATARMDPPVGCTGCSAGCTVDCVTACGADCAADCAAGFARTAGLAEGCAASCGLGFVALFTCWAAGCGLACTAHCSENCTTASATDWSVDCAESSRIRTLPSSEPLIQSAPSMQKANACMGPKWPPPLWRSSDPGTKYSSSTSASLPTLNGRGSNWSSVPAPTNATSRASWPPPARQSHRLASAAAIKTCSLESDGRTATAFKGRSLRQLRSSTA
mmetsp:Transcript_48622/g.155307  ORF Transcript_48622/g.155307 Transcript_48622/m.155307 type:complete len:225 (-) Transcript_48622:1582-2256(-)